MTKGNEDPGILRGIMLAHLVLLLQAPLVMGIAVLIIFLNGLLSYLPVIFFTGLTIAGGSAYIIYRRLKLHGKSLKNVLDSPAFSGKSIEIQLLGGVASIKIDSSGNKHTLPEDKASGHEFLQEHQMDTRQNKLIELARALENDRIDTVACNKANKDLHNWIN
jgi:hypothetical protein